MSAQSPVTEALDGPRRERPVAPARKQRDEPQDIEASGTAASTRSSRASSAQLLRACLIVFVGFLCLAYIHVGSARTARQAVVSPIEKVG